MGYVESSLAAGEVIKYRTRFHWKVLAISTAFMTVMWFLFGLSIGRAIDMMRSIATIDENFLRWVMLCGLAGLASTLLVLRDLVTFLTSEFAVTDRRVILKEGFFRRRTVELMLAKIEGFKVEQGMIGRLLGFGTISVLGTGGSREVFLGVEAPLDFRSAVQEESMQVQTMGRNPGV